MSEQPEPVVATALEVLEADDLSYTEAQARAVWWARQAEQDAASIIDPNPDYTADVGRITAFAELAQAYAQIAALGNPT
ncbi:MAG TPA: hypothetical protein VIT65_13790 [Microlunatus sp.]